MERGIYKIINPEDKIYVGLSNNIKLRWSSYKNMSSINGNSLLKESLRGSSYNNHVFEIIELIEYNPLLTEKENGKILRERERYWIKFYKSDTEGLNRNKGGCGPGKHTFESKSKISQANKGKTRSPDFGEKRSKLFYTEEWRKNISKPKPGVSKAHKGRVSPNRGKIMDEEQKHKISQSLKGRPKPLNFKDDVAKPVLQYDLDGNFIKEWSSITTASTQTKTPYAGVSLCCNGKRKFSNNFVWKFKI
jgi:group I intron endonuclease